MGGEEYKAVVQQLCDGRRREGGTTKCSHFEQKRYLAATKAATDSRLWRERAAARNALMYSYLR
jgi:hypothetical protein